MNHRDFTGPLATIGGGVTYLTAHYDTIASAVLSTIGIAYTLWRWRKEARGTKCASSKTKK